ncbi:hypothetical protein JDV02_006982 [Purpureocillium takamizusanense]|uniref:Uncharacterized protein n=1 Tax=Purpureocillium takamizusanense TaxID=2060973 RepID=A0A9Q8QKP9_9HYPO|nr:uncharacterized protein JDV02_006982 [Purpureocillium takamizusanense]UNI20936.1 hypothetical protein JDV02_006982 [Purpureocillium takamizusanense]
MMDKRGSGSSISSAIHARLEQYLRSPWHVLKDAVLFCLAAVGLFALLAPQRFTCPDTTTTMTTMTTTGGDAASSLASTSSSSSLWKTSPSTGRHASSSSSSSPARGMCNCGASVAEARRLGCRYDTLAAAWLPPRCIDQQLTNEFDHSGDGPGGRWGYWYDLNLTRPARVEDLADRADDRTFQFYSTSEWHTRHCLFYWRKMLRARFTGVLVEPRYDTEAHVTHCGSIFARHDSFVVSAAVVLNSDGGEL